MSKYNLTDILNEYIGGGRIGTLKISYRDLVDKMDELEKSGKVIVRELPGPSGDGKTNREFEVVDRDSAVPGGKKQERGFTVYDYKFGFDPGSIDNYEEEYDFSVGGNNLELAMELIDGVEPYRFQEDLFKRDGGSEDNVDNIDKVASPSAKGKGYDSAVAAQSKESGDEMKQITQTTKPMYEENVIKDLAQADEVIKMIKMMNPDVRQDLLMRIARMGQKMDENINELAGYTRKGEKEIDDKEESKFKGRAKGVGLGQLLKKVMDETTHVDDYADEIAEDDVEEQMYLDHDEFMEEIVVARAKEIAPILKGVDMDIIIDFVKTHKDDIRGVSDEEIKDEFEEFRSVNYDYIDEDLKKQFKRFM